MQLDKAPVLLIIWFRVDLRKKYMVPMGFHKQHYYFCTTSARRDSVLLKDILRPLPIIFSSHT